MTATATKSYPNGYTRSTRSIASVMHEAIAMSRDWGNEPVAVYRDRTSREYFGMVETIAGSMSDARLVCWVIAPEFEDDLSSPTPEDA